MLDRFRSLQPTRQIWVIGAAAAAIAVLLVTAWLMWLRTTYAPLFTNLREGDAAAIVAELERRKVPYRLAEGGTVILVPEDEVDGARLNVLTGDLPLKGAVGFELFNKSDMGLSDFAQRINYQRALQGELARTIMSLDGVDTARIHLSLGEDRIFRDDRVPPKASVTIRMKPGARLSSRTALGIQRLVAAAVPKLDAANVVVLDEDGQIVAMPAPPPPQPSQQTTPTKQKQFAIEQYYAARVREVLESTSHKDQFQVLVAAQVPSEAAPGSAAITSLTNWNPAARDFPLHITLLTVVPVDAAEQARVRGAVVTALGPNLDGDSVGFRAVAASALAAPDARPANASGVVAAHPPTSSLAAPIADMDFDWTMQIGLSLLVLLGMLGGFYLVARQLGGSRPLTERQRTDFTARLRAALGTGDDGAKAGS